MIQEIVVPDSEAAKKTENFLKHRFPIGYVRKLFRKHGVRLNGRRAKPEDLVRPGDRLQLYIPFEEKITRIAHGPPEPTELQILFEDHDLMVVDKPPGLAVHEGKRVPKHRSLLGFLEARHHGGGAAPKLVHRLDKDTSGILIVAKSEGIAQELETAFAKGEVRKEYLCLVAGHLSQDSGTIDLALPGRDGKPVPAVTHFAVVKRFSQCTLLRLTLETGRMHQIRQHCARIGHPIVMDDRYGDFAYNRQFRRSWGLRRQFLHAAGLALQYKGQLRKWTAPLPRELNAVLQRLEGEERR